MGIEIDLLDLYPRSRRPIEERGSQISEEDRAIAREFGLEYFDGDRLHGYGGYRYHPRFGQTLYGDSVTIISFQIMRRC